VNAATAASLYGGGAAIAADGLDEDEPAAPEAWLDGAALGEGEVDEDALAAALAADELADITPEEMTQLEAGLGRTAGSTEADSTQIDSTQIDEEQDR
jgi:hypothetical protein